MRGSPQRRNPIAGVILTLFGLGTLASASEIQERFPTPADRTHWAYQPLRATRPPTVADPRWNRNPVDQFLKRQMDRRGVEPLPPVGRATLLRRASIDLTGLPPLPREVVAFIEDDSPTAYAATIERLMASEAYGERWGRHWLDLARFAETDGFEHDLVRPNAWRYRDWVIDALNRDMPFDEFLTLQLAGDLSRPDDRDAAVATGFLLCGPDMPDLNRQDERRHQLLNEMTGAVGSVFLGLSLGCAECHDHKHDALSQFDFYRLRAFFESADFFREHPIPTEEEKAARARARAAWPADAAEHDERRRKLEETGVERFHARNPDENPSLKQRLAELNDAERREHEELTKELTALPPLPEWTTGRVLREGPYRECHVHPRGDFARKGPVVAGGFPRVLVPPPAGTGKFSPRPAPTATSLEPPRLALARWLAGREQPLVARVIVNRVWQWHFGIGLVATASDFGVMGAEPTHRELLDWLALWFVEHGGSLKALHRLLMQSEFYRTASGPFDGEWSEAERAAARAIARASTECDPENRLLWKRRPARLDAESIRDGMLVAADALAPRRGGPGVRPPLPPEVTVTLLKDQWNESSDPRDHRRRGIYLFVRRNLRLPLFDVFDFPDTNASCPTRDCSTTATQALVLWNAPFTLERARELARAIARDGVVGPRDQVRMAYLRALGRPATDTEVRAGAEFLARQAQLLPARARDSSIPSDAERVLVDLGIALFNSNEFLTVD